VRIKQISRLGGLGKIIGDASMTTREDRRHKCKLEITEVPHNSVLPFYFVYESLLYLIAPRSTGTQRAKQRSCQYNINFIRQRAIR